MGKYDELVKALRYCVNAWNCKKCAYRINNNSVKCRIKHVEDAADAIEALMPKRGEWVKDEEQSQKHVEAIYRCSACHNFDAWGATELYPYCPNCGSKMEVQE